MNETKAAGTFDIAAKSGRARTGILHTAHGPIRTPAFMPVGTAGSVKSLSNPEIESTGADVILGNTYHLWLRPGLSLLRDWGGLRQFSVLNANTVRYSTPRSTQPRTVARSASTPRA